MSIKCDNCDKPFSCKSSLIKHQKNSKSCGTESYDCSFCNKKFTTKYGLDYHILHSCDVKISTDKQQILDENKRLNDLISFKDEVILSKDKKILEQDLYYERLIVTETQSKEKIRNEARGKELSYEKQIEKLEKTIEGLHDKLLRLSATKSISTVNSNCNNNSITLNMFITPEFVKTQAINHLTYDHFADGFRGIATFVHDFILVDKSGQLVYACYDASRHILRYKDSLGNEIEDINAEKLIGIVSQPIKEKYKKMCKEFRDDIERYKQILEDDDESYQTKVEVRAKLEKTETFLTVMEFQNGTMGKIGMSKERELSRELEKMCIIPKVAPVSAVTQTQV
jgi:hypothetical protein